VKRVLLAAAALVVLAAGGVAAYVIHVELASQNVKGSSTVEFNPQAANAVPQRRGIAWATYGGDAARVHVAAGSSLAPPFRVLWTFHARSLIEFPPAVGYGRLFFANNRGVLFAVGTRNGKRAWRVESGRCQAASPALADSVVYMAYLNAQPCNRAPSPSLTGEVVAYRVGTGRVVWRRTIGPSESSPVVVGGAVYVGDWNGRIWALDRRTGKLLWVTKLRGEVKGGVAVSGNRLYVGDYSGHVYALDARTGTVRWQASAQPRLGSTGTFYATPAAAYGRVYVGATDGKVYSFGATSGKLRWSYGTGGYVYSSAAVWHDGVYVGSYSHWFYCFDAATGAVRWKFEANGPISGSATVVAGRVYFSTLSGSTFGLDATTGAVVFTFPDGKYSPVVADRSRLYLVGYTKVYALGERRAR